MATKSTASKMTEDKILGFYMDEVLEKEAYPKSIYKFCKNYKVKEEEFYSFFGSFEALKERIWHKFYENTINLLHKNEEYSSFTNKDKLLSFYYTFFEVLTLNRSYVLFTLGEHVTMPDRVKELKSLRPKIKSFAKELVEAGNEGKTLKITKKNPQVFAEGAWFQFLFLLRFWIKDSSAGFEKTDMAIEKSVTTVFDVFDNTPLDSLLDFGKFLYKETVTK